MSKEFSPKAQEILKMLDGDIADVERIVARAERLAESHWWVFAADVLKAIGAECEYVRDTPTLAARGARLDAARDAATAQAERHASEARKNERDEEGPARQEANL